MLLGVPGIGPCSALDSRLLYFANQNTVGERSPKGRKRPSSREPGGAADKPPLEPADGEPTTELPPSAEDQRVPPPAERYPSRRTAGHKQNGK